MAKRVNPMAVKANVAYDVGEAATALDVTPATIRNWIKDGMEAMTASKPHLILGEAIREYLQSKYAAAKKPLKQNELFCPSCRTGREPVPGSVSIRPVSPKTDLLKGQCAVCGGKATRMISHNQLQLFADTFKVVKRHRSKA